MDTIFRFRGRVYTDGDIASIRRLIAENPTASRKALSRRLCEAWNWRQPNGVLRDMVCRAFMLQLHRQDFIELPPVRRRSPNPLAHRKPPEYVRVDTTPITGPLARLQPLEFRQVRRTPAERIFNGLVAEHHYLGYVQPVGAHLKYIIYTNDRPIACMAWASPPRHLGLRDRFIGWAPEQRRRNLHLLAYNSRYLIVPWVRVPLLASHILGRMARMLPREWERQYGHRVYFLETFTDPARYRGTCYKAANWIVLGHTAGRGNNAPTRAPRVPVKLIMVYPLTSRFREILARNSTGGENRDDA